MLFRKNDAILFRPFVIRVSQRQVVALSGYRIYLSFSWKLRSIYICSSADVSGTPNKGHP